MYSAIGSGGAAAAFGARAEHAEFWALVCEDEEWLRAEFEAIVSQPAEVLNGSDRRRSAVEADNRHDPSPPVRTDLRAPWRAVAQQGPRLRRERSPPSW